MIRSAGLQGFLSNSSHQLISASHAGTAAAAQLAGADCYVHRAPAHSTLSGRSLCLELGRKTPVDHHSNYRPLPVADLGGGEAGGGYTVVKWLDQLPAGQLEGKATTTAEVCNH